MLITEIAPYITDNSDCKSHGKNIYVRLIEYVYYEGEYSKDTNAFIYDPETGDHAGDGEMEWLCGYCDHLIEWVGEHPQVEVR